MKRIQRLIFFLLAPVAIFGQTVHIDDNRVVYKGAVKVDNVNKEELYERAKYAVNSHVKLSSNEEAKDDKEKGKITVSGTMRLNAPYHLVRTVGYVLELYVGDGNYKYRIDSVSWKQATRGGKTIKLSGGAILKGIEATGPEAIEAEKQLNEIDLRFQKLIALIGLDIQRGPNPKGSETVRE